MLTDVDGKDWLPVWVMLTIWVGDGISIVYGP